MSFTGAEANDGEQEQGIKRTLRFTGPCGSTKMMKGAVVTVANCDTLRGAAAANLGKAQYPRGSKHGSNMDLEKVAYAQKAIRSRIFEKVPGRRLLDCAGKPLSIKHCGKELKNLAELYDVRARPRSAVPLLLGASVSFSARFCGSAGRDTGYGSEPGRAAGSWARRAARSGAKRHPESLQEELPQEGGEGPGGRSEAGGRQSRGGDEERRERGKQGGARSGGREAGGAGPNSRAASGPAEEDVDEEWDEEDTDDDDEDELYKEFLQWVTK